MSRRRKDRCSSAQKVPSTGVYSGLRGPYIQPQLACPVPVRPPFFSFPHGTDPWCRGLSEGPVLLWHICVFGQLSPRPGLHFSAPILKMPPHRRWIGGVSHGGTDQCSLDLSLPPVTQDNEIFEFSSMLISQLGNRHSQWTLTQSRAASLKPRFVNVPGPTQS